MTQEEINEVRLRVTLHRVRGLLIKGYGPLLGVFPKAYIWFPRDDINEYAYRDGNAPPDPDRPKYLRKKDLWLDFNVSPEIREFIRPGGLLDRKIEEYLEDSDESTIIYTPGVGARQKEIDETGAHKYRIAAIAEYCRRKCNPKELVYGN